MALEHLGHARVGLAGPLLAAALHEGHLGGADGVPARGGGREPDHGQHGEGQAGGGTPGPAEDGGGRLADQDGDDDEQQEPAHPQHRGERAGHLPDGQVGERHAAEGPGGSHQLGDGPRAGERQPSPSSRWNGADAEAEHGGVEDARDDGPWGGEGGHPAEAGHEAAHRHQPAAPEPAAEGTVGDEPVDADQADEGERPEPERRHRQAQRRTAGDAGGGRRQARGQGRHREMMAAGPVRIATRRCGGRARRRSSGVAAMGHCCGERRLRNRVALVLFRLGWPRPSAARIGLRRALGHCRWLFNPCQ